MNWELTGSVSGSTGTSNATEQQITCQTGIGDDTVFGFFDIYPSSTGNSSGSVDTGILPFQYKDDLWVNQKSWKVNTDPVLSQFGKVNNEPPPKGAFYVVALPDTPNANPDDPIVIDPPIDNLSRVYPGDIVAIDRVFGTGRWYVYPQRRLPDPSKTFFWDPNEDPVLESGGIVDGVLAKPGTIMIPTKSIYIKGEFGQTKLAGYYHQNVGIIFDGQAWNYYVGHIVADTGPDKDKAIWPEANYVSDQDYEYILERDHRKKFLVYTNTQATTNVLSFKITQDSTTTSHDGFFSFGKRFNVNDNLQGALVFYDHNDSYSYNYKEKLKWFERNRIVQIDSAAGLVYVTMNAGEPLQSFVVGLRHFADGNVTEWEETSVNDEGEEVKNYYKLSVSISTTLA